MTIPIHKLTDTEINQKAHSLVTKLRKANSISSHEESLLRTIIGRYIHAISCVESTERWAQEAFNESKRLMELLAERWRAGWRGNDDNTTAVESDSYVEAELRRLADKYGEGNLKDAVRSWIEQVNKEEKQCQK